MNKNKIIQSVKRQEEEKVGFSLKLPASLKNQLQKVAETESISMNALIVATLQSMIDDECGKELAISIDLLSGYKKNLRTWMNDLKTHGLDEDTGPEYEEMLLKYKQIEQLQKKD